MAQASLKPWLIGGAALAGLLYFLRGDEAEKNDDDEDRPDIVPDEEDDEPGPSPQDNLLPHVTPDDPDLDFQRVFTRTTQGATFKVLKDGDRYRAYIWISSDQKWGAVHYDVIFGSHHLASSITQAIDDAEERIGLHVENGGQVLHRGLWDPEGFS
jgi:predicted RNase H-like HicB family nuclease